MTMEDLSEGEGKILKLLNRLDKLWGQYGDDLVLFNGNSLRKGGVDQSKEISYFPSIRGEGGDGGDIFE